jgi:protein O-mannosyl-transferase
MPQLWPKRLLIIVALLASLGRLGLHEFTGWDDPATIHQNPSFHPPTVDRIAWYWTAWGDRAPMGLYVPLTYTVWGMLARIAMLEVPDPTGIRLNPYVYHSANVLLHVLGSLVAFEILRSLVGSPWAACAGALLYGLHPVQVEPVGWASGTKDVLCGMLSMVALWQYILFAQPAPPANERQPAAADHDEIPVHRSRWLHYALGLLAFVAAMLSKPTGVVVPILALVIATWGLRRPVRTSILPLLPWFVLVFPFVVLTRASHATDLVPTVAPAVRPLVAADALAFYLHKLILPIQLGVDYGRAPTRVLREGWLWFTWVVPAALAVMLWVGRHRVPMLVAGALIFVAGVLPVLGFVPFQFQYYSTVADHYLYLSMLGPALAMAWVLSRCRSAWLWAGSAAILAALGLRSFDQSQYWRDDLTLFSRSIEVNPASFVSYNNLGAALFQRVRLEEAEAHFRRAIDIFPEYPSGNDHLGRLLMARGQLEQAAHYFRIAVELDPTNVEAKDNLQRVMKMSAATDSLPATRPE